MMPASADTVIHRFQNIVARFGGRPAIRQGLTLTYEELSRRSDQTAWNLGNLGPESAPVIGLHLSQTPDLIVAMLGVMKSGRAYTVIDPGNTAQRKQAIAEAMALEVVMGDRSELWPGFSGHWIDSSAIAAEQGRSENFQTITSATRCCVLQTSGTTGEPMGVEITHASLLHTIENYATMARIVPEDRFTLLTSPAHFAAHTAIFGALLNGACLFPFDVRTLGFPAMGDWLDEEALTIYQSPPSLFRTFARQLSKGRTFSSLRFLRLGGEPVLLTDLGLFREHFSRSAQFVNALGISEAGGNVAYLKIDRESAFSGPVLPIGSPSAGQDVFLADSRGKPVAQGEVGEIVVRGEFLAAGYYRRPDLTARKFRTSGADGRRELWTGDLAHMMPEGWLMHDGRKDDQVKINGHRVDVAGLEAILHSIPEVREARVLTFRTSAEAEGLVAFVVPADPAVKAGFIRRKLSELYVAPVIPRVLLLECMPLNHSGKIDRARLLQLAAESTPLSCPPRNETERELAKILSSALGVDDIGVYDNFFDSGGDSLTVLSASSSIEDRFAIPFAPWIFLHRPTIAQMSEYINARRKPRTFRRWQRLLDRERAEQIVTLRSTQGKMQAPLFVCPGGWGHERELLVFASMLQHLPPDLPVYGLKQNFLADSVPVTETIGTIARNFLAAIKSIQSNGPYRLLGECIASVVILELGRQLELAGDVVETIILLEPRLPRTLPPDTGTESDEVAEKVRRYYQILAEAKLQPCVRRVHVIGTEGDEQVRHRLGQWNVFDETALEIIRVSGDHDTYLRQHSGELAGEIVRAISRENGLNRMSKNYPGTGQRIAKWRARRDSNS